MDDWQLLREYADHGSREAFGQLVERHLPMVYATARAQVGDEHLAEDITQAAFLILLKKAATITPTVVLGGWLFQTTRFVATNALRQQRRRRHHEKEAAAMAPQSPQAGQDPSDALWRQIVPHLHAAVAGLRRVDRDVVVLRFLEGRSLRDTAEALGINENTAKQRVFRAVRKLRDILAGDVAAVSTAALEELLSRPMGQPAPACLASAVIQSVWAAHQGAATSATFVGIAEGAIRMMGWAKIQSAATATLLLILTTGILSLGLRHLLAQSGGGVRAPSAVAVLERYEQSLKALSQIGFEAELRQQWTYPGQSSPSDRTNYYLTHWRDGDRWDTSYRIEAVDAQGDLLRLDEHGSPMPSPPTIRGVIGPMTFSYTRQEGRLLQVGMMEKPEPSSLFVQKKRCMHLEATLLSGYSPEDSGLALVEVLHSDKSLIVREGMAQVDGHRTYVLEGTGRYGRHELWLDPAAGYCPRRIVLEKSAGDLFQGKRLSSSLSDSAAHYDPFKPEAPLSKYLLQLDSMQLQQIQGVWVPVACAIIEQRTYANAQQVVTKCQYTRRNIQLRPDFSGVGAFEVDVPDGTPVNYEDGPNAGRVGMFQWRGGKVVPVSGRRDLR